MKSYPWNIALANGRALVNDNRADVDYPMLRQQIQDDEQLVYLFVIGSLPFAFFIEVQNDFSELERRYNINEIKRIGIYAAPSNIKL
jgi:hypothetical protein